MLDSEGNYAFQGCTAISCARHVKNNRKYSNYLIEENCRYAANSQCTFKRSHSEISRAQPQAQESAGITTAR